MPVGSINTIRARMLPCLLAFIIAAMLACPALAYADVVDGDQLDLFADGEGYAAILYNNTNGLPTSEANDIVQTSDGFIWIGSYSGLVRYDGNTFERMDSSMHIDSVACLFVDSKDRLWIGTNDSGLAMLDHNELHRWDTRDGLGSSMVCSIVEDMDGTIVVATSAGISMIREDFTIDYPRDYTASSTYVDEVCLSKDGRIYALTNEDDFFSLRRGKLDRYIDHRDSTIESATCIFPDPTAPGSIYIGTEGTNLYHGAPARGVDSFEIIDISPLVNIMDMELIGDKIWLSARNGIGVIDGQGFRLIDDLPMNNSVCSIMEDYEGNIWFTSTRQGVMKIVPNQFGDIFGKYDLQNEPVNTTCLYEDMLLIGTDTGIIALDGEDVVPSIPLTSARTAGGVDLGATDLVEYLQGCRIRSILRDSQGRLWISTWRSLGLLCYSQGELIAFNEEDGIPSNHVRAIDETADGKILVACTGGGCLIDGDQIVKTFGSSDGIFNPETLTVCVAPNGDFLFGSNGDGIYVVGEHGKRHIGKNYGLTSDVVMRIKYDSERDLFWIVTANSLAYMTTDYTVTTVRNFPYSNNFDLYENSKGEMWVLCSYGIYTAPIDELVENGEIDSANFGLANGMPCTPTSNSYSELTDDGELYIAGSSGVVKVNIDTAFEKVIDLKQGVPFIDCDGEHYYPDQSGTFTIPSTVRRLIIHPYVFNYSLSDPQVTYQLEGFDDAPTTVIRSDLAPLTYTNLRGGTYTFVMSLDGASAAASNTMSVSIVKEMALYERPWFGPSLLVLVSGIVALGVRQYVRRKMRLLEEKHRAEAEQERIANELHMANEIQGSMLPHIFPPFPDRSEFDIFAVMDPAREVGGDFYDFFLIDEDHLCLVIADVSGKGVPAALFMMISKIILQSYATYGESVGEILTRANETICSNNQLDMFVTVWLGILEISTGRIVAANAGHEFPVVRRVGRPYELIKDKHGFVIGGMDGLRYRKYDLQLNPGDRLFLYTDGLPEATDSSSEMFGTERMIAALNDDDAASPRECLERMRGAVDAFVKDAEQFDDLTMLCLDYNGPAAS